MIERLQRHSPSLTSIDYPQADLRIEEVNVSPGRTVTPGTSVSVEVVVNDVSSVTEEFVAGYCIVQASGISEPVLFHCAIMEPEGTFRFDDVCSICPGSEDFTMPESTVDLSIQVGAPDRSRDCPGQLTAGTPTDTTTVAVTPNADLEVVGCITDPSPIPQGETDVHYEATVQSNIEVTHEIRWMAGGNQLAWVRCENSASGGGDTCFTRFIGEGAILDGGRFFTTWDDFANAGLLGETPLEVTVEVV